MKSSVIAVIVIAVAALVLLLFLMSADRPAVEMRERDALAMKRIDALERDISNIQQHLEQLSEEREISWEKIAVAKKPSEEPRGTSGDNPEETDEPEKPFEDKPVTEIKEPETASERFRRLVREEIVAVEEEKKRKLAEERKAMQPEEWEKEEFGNLAWSVHRTGNKLDLTRDQKRQYHAIIKEDMDRIRTLWKDLKEQYPDAETAELSKMYQERTKEMTKTTRELVSAILSKEQQEKYEKESKANQWFK
ncbi:MAG: hypothetical protein E3J72_01410 [Planctomycetota bacterium]|nr:MAG: hypothetical protein E3J72_01410 [Planctomycetota bacterium]